tara:strand:+ start:1027 stop:1794 length:768 start_codon:yes stop_codon:yes gene_type:complete
MVQKYNKYNKLYSEDYYENLSSVSYKGAKIVLNELYKVFPFKSMVDFGCGSASWLKAASEIIESEKKLTGIDGKYSKNIHIFNDANFIYTDLENEINVEKHDLAISLETAEHLSPKRAESFVRDLCKASDMILFSAAVDGHGGTNHLNENNQSYWISHFEKNDYDPFIFIDRKKYWYHESFKKCPYYISGSFLYIKRNTDWYKKLSPLKVKKNDLVDIVHPYILSWRKDENFGVKMNFRRFINSVKKFLKKKTNI